MVNWHYSFFSVPVMDTGSKVHTPSVCHSHILHISSVTTSHMAGLGKHLVIFVSASQQLTRLWSLCVYSIFSNYIVAGCSPEVTWTTVWDCGRSFHKIGVVQKFLAVMEINPQKGKVIQRLRRVEKMSLWARFWAHSTRTFCLFISKICDEVEEFKRQNLSTDVQVKTDKYFYTVFSCTEEERTCMNCWTESITEVSLYF